MEHYYTKAGAVADGRSALANFHVEYRYRGRVMYEVIGWEGENA